MRSLAFVSQKGGVGKTSLAIHVAVAAQERGEKVVLIDNDPQKSLLAWSQQRESDKPVVIACSSFDLENALAAARHDRMTLAVIDSAPHSDTNASKLASLADLVAVPVRPSALDLASVAATVTMVQALKAHAVFVLNSCPPRAPEISEARAVLVKYGLPVFTGEITDRRSFGRAVAGGLGVTEYDPESRASEEIRALWKWLNKKGSSK